MVEFDYETAFARNIGWVTRREQALLKCKRVAIAGLGGVGGSHLLTLTRLGIGAFTLADLDTFELANFNRQAGAGLSSIGREKAHVVAEKALDINPDLDLRIFDQGVSEDNVDDFLDGADLYLDGLDFFAVNARRNVFAACYNKRIPAVTAAPLGFSTAVLNFLPGRMSFEEYFQLDGHSEEEQLLRFFVGLAPAGLHRHALVDPTTIDLPGRRGPSTAVGCEMCAGLAAAQVVKILLGRGKVIAAPTGIQVDTYTGKLAYTRRARGNRHPLQRLAMSIARRQFMSKPKGLLREESVPTDVIGQILTKARWAPSGDNTQPWRFEITGDTSFVVHGHDTRDWCVYDLEGRASQIALGALLETIDIAASKFGLEAKFQLDGSSSEQQPRVVVALAKSDRIADPLYPFIEHRVTQRRPFSRTSLQPAHIEALESSVPDGFEIVWIVDPAEKKRMARLLFDSARIRLTIREAFEVHRRIIEWDSRYSSDRIPDQAIGLDPLNLKAMRWAMGKWERVVFLNRYLAGTLTPRLMLDYLPGVRCAAHFVIVSDREPTSTADYLDGGRAMQRFWLTSARLGLQFQPEMTPLIFAGYARQHIPFTDDDKARRSAEAVASVLESVVGEKSVRNGIFMGRVGYGNEPSARSIRLPLASLMQGR